MSAPCANPRSLDALAAYWLDALDPDEEGALEAHLFDCPECAGRLADLTTLGRAVADAFARGLVRAVISPALLARMKAGGLRVREYPVAPGGHVDCTLTADDDAVVGRLAAPLAGIARLDLVRVTEQGDIRYRLADIPFDPDAGEVLVCPSAAALRLQPAHVDRLQLRAVEPDGERLVAEYVFDHTPG